MRREIGQILKRAEVIRIQYGDSDCPHEVLGRHMTPEGQVICAYHPQATGMKILCSDGAVYEMEAAERTAVYTVYIPRKDKFSYQIEARFEDGNVYVYGDPYSFEPQITDYDLYLFGKGTHYNIYEKLGAHPMTIDGVRGTYFAVWAPAAKRVSVVGDFCLWDGRRYPMRRLGSMGIFELFIPGLYAGTVYKYEIKTAKGPLLLKADPYGNHYQVRPANASVVADLNSYNWKDTAHMKKRQKQDIHRMPMAVYEVHLPSWRRTGSNGNQILDYKTLAHQLADYVKEMGYTHVELIGISEHPLDGSWGYQVTGYYAPTSRHGNAEDFMYFVDYMHQKGIGVILDWVPGHFPKDPHGLARFDGTCLYEHPDPCKGEQPEWNTLVFNYERNEIRNFLTANAIFWMTKFHIDGIRTDAVASMLYLDYGRTVNQWKPNEQGGRENLQAVEFLRTLNEAVKQYGCGGFMIAEESTAWPGVSRPAVEGGLGFDFKWNMGWMHDFLVYMKQEPKQRRKYHRDLIFSMHYAYTEDFIQVLSHDEVVHGKGSMIRKMPGNDAERFANLRLAYGYMFGHPGKKLLFMGQEFGQWAEWSEGRSLDWHLLQHGPNSKLKDYVKMLLSLYQKNSALYELDYDKNGFQWMSCNNEKDSCIAFVRRGGDGRRNLLFVYNFSSVFHGKYRIGVPAEGCYRLILSSDEEKFGGTRKRSMKKNIMAEKTAWDGMGQSIVVTLPPLTMLIYEYSEERNE